MLILATSDPFRCFLYLQNYARLKPEIALQALPVLQEAGLSSRVKRIH